MMGFLIALEDLDSKNHSFILDWGPLLQSWPFIKLFFNQLNQVKNLINCFYL